ncbi:Programmed cell death protein 4, partial [Galemys pyrenaicus]
NILSISTTSKVVEMLRDLNLGDMKSGVPVLAVSLALEEKASHREMTSKLPSDAREMKVNTNDCIAKAAEDRILCNTYTDSYKGTIDCIQARAALDKATVLLTCQKMESTRTVCGALEAAS